MRRIVESILVQKVARDFEAFLFFASGMYEIAWGYGRFCPPQPHRGGFKKTVLANAHRAGCLGVNPVEPLVDSKIGVFHAPDMVTDHHLSSRSLRCSRLADLLLRLR